MLEEMRRAAVLLRLDCRAAAQVVGEGNRSDVRKRLDQDRHPGGEDMPADGRRGFPGHAEILMNRRPRAAIARFFGHPADGRCARFYSRPRYTSTPRIFACR